MIHICNNMHLQIGSVLVVIFSCNAFSELVSFNLKWIVSVTQPPALPPFPIAKEVKEIIK